MKRDMRPLSAGNLSGSSRGFGRSRPGTAGRLSTTRSAPHLKKLAPPKFLSSGENSVAKTSQPFGSSSATMSLDLSADPTLAALLESVGDTSLSGGLDDSNALVAVVAARPSRELSVTFEESEADVVPQVDSPQKGSPLKSPKPWRPRSSRCAAFNSSPSSPAPKNRPSAASGCCGTSPWPDCRADERRAV